MKGRRLGARLAIVAITAAAAAWLAAGWPAASQAAVAAHGCPSATCRGGAPAARDLPATQQAQLNGYFCGPATVSEMLAQVGRTVTQGRAAEELGTDVSGTGWSDLSGNPVPRVLNQNQQRNSYVAVALPWAPTRSQVRAYERNLVTDINRHGGVPLAGDADEVPGGPHLVGHPVNQTIFHWFDIRGYQKYGALTDYEDSVHNASSIGWSATVPAYSTLPSATIVDIIGARGYDW
jgi:Peptidase_C39 like family